MDTEFSSKSLGQDSRARVYFLIKRGMIPKTYQANAGEEYVTIVFYNQPKDRAVVSIASFEHKQYLFYQSPFVLERKSFGWQVTTGPLGPGTQDAVAEFVSRRAGKPLNSVLPSTIKPTGMQCGDGPLS